MHQASNYCGAESIEGLLLLKSQTGTAGIDFGVFTFYMGSALGGTSLLAPSTSHPPTFAALKMLRSHKAKFALAQMLW